MQLLVLTDELAARGLGRYQIADDDIGDERGPKGVGDSGRSDDRARELEHRPQEMPGLLVVVDDEHVN